MNNRVAFRAIVVAFVVWLILALWAGRSAGGAPSEKPTGPEPPAVPPDGWVEAPAPARRRPRRRVRLFPRSWLRGALCVHSHEGSWRVFDPPFYGGMQFDLGTWLSNGGRRFASYPNRATPTDQLRVAYVTWCRRGWEPWPTTARMCGLL